MESKTISKTLASERWALALIFFTHGALFASWAGRIPQLQERLSLSDGQLGLSMFCMAIGALVSMPVSGMVSLRFSSAITTVVSTLCFAIVLALLPLAPTWLLFCGVLTLFGFAMGSMDVSMNAHAVHVERAFGRTIMSGFHGMFSVGAMCGAGFSALACAINWAPQTHLLLVSTTFVISTLIIARLLIHGDSEDRGEDKEPAVGLVLPDRHLLILAMVAFCSFIGEGAISDWSAVYLSHELHASHAVAAAGFSVFCTTMAIFRFFGDALVDKLGPVKILMGGGVLAGVGIGAGLLVPIPYVVLAFYLVAGIGFSSMVPVAFSTAGRSRHAAPGVAIAGVATLGYFGFIIAPPIIGLLADKLTLRVALWLPAILSFLVAVMAPAAVAETMESA